MKLILVRHGETQWNKSNRFQGQNDVPLNRRGLAQARQTARSLAQSPCTAVYSSPLIRTMQAAREISGVAGRPVVEVDGLMELNLGDLEGVTGEKMRADWPEVYDVWRANPAAAVMPNGESLTQLQARAWKSFLEVESAHQDEDTLVLVSHNFAIRTIVCQLLGVSLANFHQMVLSLSSICAIDSNRRGRRLSAYNCTGHLSARYR